MQLATALSISIPCVFSARLYVFCISVWKYMTIVSLLEPASSGHSFWHSLICLVFQAQNKLALGAHSLNTPLCLH